MATGKQLSFQHGEVAPTHHFRSDMVAFNTGLRKLRNAFVRRDGGVSNRSGFELYEPSEYQENVNTLQHKRQIKSFQYTHEGSLYTLTAVKTDSAYGYDIFLNDVNIVPEVYYNGASHEPCQIYAPDPEDVRFTMTKDGVFISPACTIIGATLDVEANIMLSHDGTKAWLYRKKEKANISWTTGTKYGYSGRSPFLPVTYCVTVTFKDGREAILYQVQSEVASDAWPVSSDSLVGGVTIYHPHSQLSAYAKLVFTNKTLVEDVKFFNLYRASGSRNGQGFLKLVSRIANDFVDNSFMLNDYGGGDPTQTAPLDYSIWPSDSDYINNVSAACYYQQRLMINPTSLLDGEVAVSEIGAPKMFAQPLLTQDTKPFVFSVPIKDSSPVVGMLSMERAILMTRKGVYIVRGGEQGILTPSTPNPLKISSEGCSGSIEPVTAGSYGFWVSADHRKLMCVRFGLDGNAEVFEASLLANHIMKKGITQLEVVGDSETSVYAVTYDGKLVQVTVSDDGAMGFAVHEIDGVVESIYAGYGSYTTMDKGSYQTDILYAYVLKNGVRWVLRLTPREDEHRELENYADYSLKFGTRNFLDAAGVGAPGYIKSRGLHPFGYPGWSDVDPFGLHINIEAGAHSWGANETIKIRSVINLIDNFGSEDQIVIHFYYDELDADGNVVLDKNGRPKTKTLRYMLDKTVPAVATGEVVDPPWANTALNYEFEGYFESDVPEQLRDVRSQFTTDDYEFFLRQTRWSPAFRYLRAATADALAISPLRALYEISGGGPLTVVAEGDILSSPDNPEREETVSIAIDGSDYVLDLGDYYGWGYMGIGYQTEIETLDIEPGDNRTLTDAKKIINAVGLGFIETRGGFFGLAESYTELEKMEPHYFRDEGDITLQTQNVSGHQQIQLPTDITQGGRILVKNVDPVPLTIVSVYPKGIAGE